MAHIGDRPIDPPMTHSNLAIKRSKLPFKKAKGVRREPERIEFFLAEKEHLASVKNCFLPLEACYSRTLIVRLERIDDLIKKYKDKREANNSEATSILSSGKTNNDTQENSLFTDDACGGNLSQEDISSQLSSSPFGAKHFFTDNHQIDGSCTSQSSAEQLCEYGNSFWSVDCIVCKEQFADRLELHKHASLSHPGMQISFCDVCGKPFFGKKSFCHHTTSESEATPCESPVKDTESNEKDQVPTKKIAKSSNRLLAKKRSCSSNSKTQKNVATLKELTSSKRNSIIENQLSNSNKTLDKIDTMADSGSEFHKNLFETVIHHSLNLVDKCEGESSRCNRRTRAELRDLDVTDRTRSLRKRKENRNASQCNAIDKEREIVMEKTTGRKGPKRRKVQNSAIIVAGNNFKIATNKEQAEKAEKASAVNEIDISEKEIFNYSCVKSEKKAPIALIKTEEQITDWFVEDFTSGEEAGVASAIKTNSKAITPTKKLEQNFKQQLLDATSLEAEIDISNKVSWIDLEENVDIQVADSSSYETETNIILPEVQIHISQIDQRDDNCSIVDEIIVIQLKSDDSAMEQASEVFQEKSRSSTHEEDVLDCGTEIKQDQNLIEKLAMSVETLKQNEIDASAMDEIECICVVESLKPDQKPEVEIIEENPRTNFGKTDSGECVIMEPIEENGGKDDDDDDQSGQNILNNLENADSGECVIVVSTGDREENIPEEAEEKVFNNFGNVDSSECVILEATRDTGEPILEKDTIEQNVYNIFDNTDSSSKSAIVESTEDKIEENSEEDQFDSNECGLMEATEDGSEEKPEEHQVEQDICSNSEKPVSIEDKAEQITEEILIERKDTANSIESEDLETNGQSDTNASEAPIIDTQLGNHSIEHESNSNKSLQHNESVELNISDKSNNVRNSESESNAEGPTRTVTRGSLKIIDQSILIHPACRTTWKCTDCSTSFDEYLNLLLHKTEVHRYACTTCNKFFDCKSNLLLHMNALHPEKLRKELDHAAEQARINELMIQAYKMNLPKEPNNSSKKRKSNTNSKDKSLATSTKKAKTDTKNKIASDAIDSEKVALSRHADENKSNEVTRVVIDVSGKNDSNETLLAEHVQIIKESKNETMIDRIDSEEKLSPETAMENEVNEENEVNNVVIDVPGNSDCKKQAPAGPAKTNSKGKNVEKNKIVIANTDISGKTNSKKKAPAKLVKRITGTKTFKKSKALIVKVDYEQKTTSDPEIEKFAERSEALMDISGQINSEKLSTESATLIENIDSEKDPASDSVAEEYVIRIDKEKNIAMDVPEENNSNEKSPIDRTENIKSPTIHQEDMTVMENIDSDQKSLSQSVEENKADDESEAAMDVSKETASKEKSQTKPVRKTKSKKSTKVTDANKPDSKKEKPPSKSKPVKKSKTVRCNTTKTKTNNSQRNAKTSKKKDSRKLGKKKLAKENQSVTTSRHDSASMKNFETDNSIQKDTEAKSDDPTNSNFVSVKENLDPQSLVNRLTKKSMEGTKTSWMCIKCQQHFLIRHEYIEHSLYAHEDMTLISICDKCGEVLTSIESAKNHKCEDVIVWSCEICSTGFTTGIEFMQHNRGQHLEISVLHTCETCHRSFLTEAMLMKHQEVHDISNMVLSEIVTLLTSNKLKNKSANTSSKKAGKSSSKKSEQTVNEKSAKGSSKKKEKKTKDRKLVKVIVKKTARVNVNESVKSTKQKVAKVKKSAKVLTKKPSKAPNDKPTKVSKKKLTKKLTEESAEESPKVSTDQSKESSEAPPPVQEGKADKSKRKPKEPVEKSQKASTETPGNPASKNPVQTLFKKAREFGPRSRKYLPAKFHFFNYQTFQSAFAKIQMPCLFCEDVFRSSGGYINHLLRTHHTSGEECQICRNTFAHETMIHHLLTAHVVPSDVNKVSLKPKESLASITDEDKDKPINQDTDFIVRRMDKKRLFLLCQYHAFDHLLKNESFLCPWCNKVMEHPRHYRIHFLTAHDKTCVICNVEFEISQVAALHKSKIHGYVGSYLWFTEIIVRTLVNSKQYGPNPKDIMLHMISSDDSTYKELVNNLTDGKVMASLNNSDNSCNQGTSGQGHQNDISKSDKIMDIDTSSECQTANDDSSIIPVVSDNC